MTFANAEIANRSYISDCLLPITTQLEQEIDRKLFRRALPGRGQPFSKFNFGALVLAETEKRFASYAMAANADF